MTSTSFGIAKIALHQPEQVIANHWYGESLLKKFVNHTGIEERHISFSDEVTMAVECIEQMLTESAIKQGECWIDICYTIICANAHRKSSYGP